MQLLASELGEKALTGLYTFIIGLVMVFAVLFLLILIISLMKSFSIKKKKVSVKEPVAPVAQSAGSDDEELIAAITAAISACMESEEEVKADFIVRKIKKLS